MTDLQTATLGRTGLEVTKLAYGAISQRRDEYFLASKCGCIVGDAPPGSGPPFEHVFTRENIRAAVEQSLERMHTDHLDLVQVHMSPPRRVLEEHGAVDELEALRDAGKVRFIGMSGVLPDLADHISMGVFDAFQIPYSALERDHEEAISSAARAGGGTIIRGGVARRIPDMFGSDYPHPEGTWPNTHEWIRSAFAGCTEADACKILGENALRVFRFDAGAIDKAAASVGPRASDVLGDFDVDPKLIDHFNARAGFGKPADQMTSEDLDPLIEESLAVTAG